MPIELATTGSNALLEDLSPFIPDEFINQLLPAQRGAGRRRHWTPAQLFRLLLLAILTPVHSYNLLLELLPEQRSWRKFARLPNRHRLPVASQLHDFRAALGVGRLRRINETLVGPLLDGLMVERKSVGLIDATDLPAATSAFKKRRRDSFPPAVPLWGAGRSRLARAAGLLVTKNTPCVCGSTSELTRSY